MWLRIRVVAAFAICIGIPVLAGMAAIIFGAPYFLRDGTTQDLQAATSSVLVTIEDRVAQNLENLKAWSSLPLMQDVLIGDEGGDIARTIAGFKARYGDFASLSVSDARGVVIASTAKGEKGTNIEADEGFRAASSGSVFQSALGFRTADTPETIWFTVPLIAGYDRQTVIGTLTGVLDFNALAKSAMSRSTLAALGGAGSHALVLARRNDKRIVFASSTDANLLQALTQIDDRKTRTGVEVSWGDKQFFVATAGSKAHAGRRDLALLARGIAPSSSALAVADSLSNMFIAVTGVAILIAIYLAWAWSGPLVQLTGAMTRLAKGDIFWRMPNVLPHHAFAEMARSLEVFRQTKIVRDKIVAREQGLLRAKNEAEASVRAKSEHLASLSRELKSQLNAIVGLSELINRESLAAAGNAHHAGYAKDIARCGVQLLSVINDLFDLSEAEAGHLELNEADVDLGELVRESVLLMDDAGRKARVSVSSEGCGELVTARVDAQKLKQILFNLLSNAVKFTCAGGHVCASLKVSPDGRPTIAVEDNGIGMPANLSPVALAPFSVSDDALNHGRHGAGLGLPLVRQLVELHQGSIEIESEVGKGTTVTVSLPASRLVTALEEETEQRLSA